MTPAARPVVASIIALAAAGLAVHALGLAALQGPLLIDDAYISFRYAANLAAGHGPVFNPGERVEGYTNFGWVILMAVLARLGIDPPGAARLLNFLLGIALVVVALRFLAARSRRPAAAAAIAGALLAADGSLARWTQEGMETVLFAFLVLAGAVLATRDAQRPGALPRAAWAFGLATLVRPEGLLFFAAAMAYRAATGRGRPGVRRALALDAAIFAAIILPHVLWRFSYYGALLPNTFHAKVGATAAQAARGAGYLARFCLAGRWPLLLFAAASLLRRPWRDGGGWQGCFIVLGGAHLLYVTLVGGDWMGPGRFLVPVMALLYLPAAESIALALAPPPGRAARPGALATGLAALALLAGQFVLTSARAEQKSVRAERAFSESRAAVAGWLRDNARPGDTLLTNEIGQLAWLSGLATDDLYGLTDPAIARLAPRAMGAGKAGHEKYDLEYSFARRPVWVCIPGIGRSYAAWGNGFAPFSAYVPVAIPRSLPRPEYQVILHRRGPA